MATPIGSTANIAFGAIGDKLENFPDKDYGIWLSQYYKNVARTGRAPVRLCYRRNPTAARDGSDSVALREIVAAVEDSVR